jgi:predicted DsbA family dithiol-disulfide isomerase
MDATYYFDPACPFTWRTSRWLVAVAPERDVTVQWRPFSLSILNGDRTPEQYKPMMAASSRALRLVAALAADGRDDQIGAFYTDLGSRTFDAGAPISDDAVDAAAAAAGIPDAKTILDDPAWDDAVKTSHDKAVASAGPDIGSPVLEVSGAARGVHGPIISEVPDTAEAVAIWDATVPLIRSSTFFEVKRGRR